MTCPEQAEEHPGRVVSGREEQGVFLRDIHGAMLRLLEGLDEELLEAPTLAGYGAAADLGPQHSYRHAARACSA